MSIQENRYPIYEANHADFLREEAIKISVNNVRRIYYEFLRGPDKEKIVFKADFVQGRKPLSFLIYAQSTFTEVEYETLEPELNNVFEGNRIKRDDKRVEDVWKVMKELPPLLTDNLIEFAGEFPHKALEVHKKFELLQGKGNPLHASVISRYFEEKSATGLAEIWMVKKLKPIRIPIAQDNKRTELIPYPTLTKIA